MTYQELQDAIGNMLTRPNMQNAGIMIPLFIRLAEGRLNRKLRVEDGVLQTSIPTVAGLGNYLLPTRCTGIRTVQIANGGKQQSLEPLTPEQSTRLFYNKPGGYPTHFSRQARYLWVRPIPNSAEWLIYLEYYATLAPMADNPSGNWLSQKYPDVYVWQSMAIAAHHEKNYEARDSYQLQADNAIQELHDADAGDLWSGGTHAMKAG